MSTALTAPATSPALEFIRDQLPGLLGITDPPLTLVYAALVDQLAAGRVFDGLTVSDARRVMVAATSVCILDYPPRSTQDAARELAKLAERALTGHGEVDRLAVGLAYVRAVAVLLS